MGDFERIRTKWEGMGLVLTERQCRLWAGSEALVLGNGGVTMVSEATGLSRPTVQRGKEEMRNIRRGQKPVLEATESREGQGGRPRAEERQEGLVEALLALVEPTTRGEPESALRWTCKSLRKLADELSEQGFVVGSDTVSRILKEHQFSLQAPSKTREGADHPDRDAQFRKINEEVDAYQAEGEPVISVDAKKKEKVGVFHNPGQEWQPQGEPEKVNTHDFPVMVNGKAVKAVPYGIYDIANNEGFVSVGMSADTAEFSVNAIRSWYYKMGQHAYPNATKLLITADGGGSNGYRLRLFKSELQKLSDEIGISLRLMHFPRGTSKWNKIEHRLFSAITINWRGRPLTSFEVVVNCIANTKNASGLEIQVQLDEAEYLRGVKVSDERMAQLNLHRDEFHGEWNYTVKPSGGT